MTTRERRKRETAEERDKRIVAEAGPWLLRTCDLQSPHSTPQGSLSVVTINVAVPFVWARNVSLAETMEALIRVVNRMSRGRKANP